MSLPLLQTKLYIPTPRPQLVLRPAVTAKLHQGAVYPLTLVAAPAGFGKTILISEWISQTDQPVAWLSLGDDDNDPGQFFRYLVAALRSVHPHVGETTLAALYAPQLPPLTALLTPLLNDLSQLTDPLALVLDDYHVITAQPIHEALTFLIEQLPPALRLVITTRIDPPLPLARWRVRGRLAEVRADELRFNSADATTFFNQVMGLQLTAREIVSLETRTEGWIAGLQLAALSMQGRDDVSSFLQSFSGSHRHVFSYLVEEVLDRRPSGTLDFLVQTAILERLNADLCNAVTGRSDCQALLEKIEQANLFLIPLDDERKWYRYHHLFAEVLREHLRHAAPQTIPALHQRAAAWFETQALWSEAIQHALTAADFAIAARLIEQVGIARFAQPDIQRSLQRWLATLPPSVIVERPRLCLIYAFALFIRLDLAAAIRWLTAAESALQRNSAQLAPDFVGKIAGEIAAIRTMQAAYSLSQTPDEAITWGQQALAALGPDQAIFRSITAVSLGMAYLKQSDVRSAEEALAEAKRMSQLINNIYSFVAAAANQTLMQRALGSISCAQAICHEALAWVNQRRAAAFPIVGSLYLNLADLLRSRNELEQGEQYAQSAVIQSDQGINPHFLLISRLVLLWIQHARGKWAQAWAQLNDVAALAAEHPHVIHSTLIPAISAQLHLAEGRVAAGTPGSALTKAYAWAQSVVWEDTSLSSAYNPYDFVYMLEHSRLARAQVFIAWARCTKEYAHLHETLAYLQRQQQMAETSHLGWYLIKVQLLQALIQHTLGDTVQSFALLTASLCRAEPEGHVRVFVDEGEPLRLLLGEFRAWLAEQTEIEQRADLSIYVSKLLAAFPTNQPTRAQPAAIVPSKVQSLVEPLTERELEILQLVADGLSNSQLADKLIVTVGTVKKHLNNIYGKLGVASRTQAVERGRELGLLAD